MSPLEGGWNKNILSWNFTNMVLADLPGWEEIKRERNCKIVSEVWLEHIREASKESRDIAVEWDDVSQGCFYYRDYTESSLPIVGSGEKYWSMFNFQFKSDAVKFQEIYGGHGNWQDGYDKMLHSWKKENARCGCRECAEKMMQSIAG